MVNVDFALETKRLEERNAAETEHGLLAESIALVAAIEAIGQRLVVGIIFRVMRIEEVDRNFMTLGARDHVPPRADAHGASFHRKPERDVNRLETRGGIPNDRRFGLAAGFIEVLAEVALPMQKA